MFFFDFFLDRRGALLQSKRYRFIGYCQEVALLSHPSYSGGLAHILSSIIFPHPGDAEDAPLPLYTKPGVLSQQHLASRENSEATPPYD